MYNIIKDYYNLKLFNDDSLELFVKVGWIDVNQKAEIISSKATQ